MSPTKKPKLELTLDVRTSPAVGWRSLWRWLLDEDSKPRVKRQTEKKEKGRRNE